MKKKRKKRQRRSWHGVWGRKPNCSVLSGIKPDQETCDEIRCRIFWGSPDWPMVALQNLIKNGSQLPSNYLSAPSAVRCSPYAQRPAGVYPLWNKLCYEFERAVLNGDANGSDDRPMRLRKMARDNAHSLTTRSSFYSNRRYGELTRGRSNRIT